MLLLPATNETENIINQKTINYLSNKAVIINPGRGPLIDEEALLEAIQNGKIRQATHDVYREEPLPKNPHFWAHPKITVTPHIASETRAETASKVIATNIDRFEKGQPLLNQVDYKDVYYKICLFKL